MRRKFYHIALGIALLSSTAVWGQQLPQYSQYMQNLYLLNPAAAGKQDYLDVTLGYRQQWANYSAAPETFYISANTALGKNAALSHKKYSIPISTPSLYDKTSSPRKPKNAVGFIVSKDKYGAFDRTSITLGYAYHQPIGKKSYLSGGVNLGWAGIHFLTDKISLENPNDNTYNDFIANGNKSNVLDANAGVLYYNDKFFAGFSFYQLLQNNLYLGNQTPPQNLSDAKLKLHKFGMAGYTFNVSDNISLTPSVLVKWMSPAPVSYDFNVKADYNKTFWLGVSYRREDAVAIMMGALIKDFVRIGYSYDYTLSELSNYSSGSHEITLGLNLWRNR